MFSRSLEDTDESTRSATKGIPSILTHLPLADKIDLKVLSGSLSFQNVKGERWLDKVWKKILF